MPPTAVTTDKPGGRGVNGRLGNQNQHFPPATKSSLPSPGTCIVFSIVSSCLACPARRACKIPVTGDFFVSGIGLPAASADAMPRAAEWIFRLGKPFFHGPSSCLCNIKSAKPAHTSSFRPRAAGRLPCRPRFRSQSRPSKSPCLQKPPPW